MVLVAQNIGQNVGTSIGVSAQDIFYEVADFGSHQFGFGPQLTTDGIVNATLEIVLPKNAVVRQYDVVVKAQRADATVVQNVAQVRSQESQLGTSAVLDFGTPRTVSAVRAPEGLEIGTVKAWTGAAFATTNAYAALIGSLQGPTQSGEPLSGTIITATAPSTKRTAIFPSEVRTERLLVDMLGTANAGELGAGMAVVLPESPQGLEVRIDGAQPVFTDPGPVAAGPDSALSDSAWNSAGERIVHLGDGLAALTGDPTATGTVTFKVVLTSRVPGVLGIRLRPDGQDVHYIRRVLFGSDLNKELTFEAKGVTDVPLGNLPPNLTIEEVRFTASGTFLPERVLPPAGPDASGVAELVVDATRALLVRLRKLTGLAELTGVRLPLRASRAAPKRQWRCGPTRQRTSNEPLESIPQAVTTPVTLTEGAEGADEWTTFEFGQPAPLDRTNPPWAALLVTRGELNCQSGGVRERRTGGSARRERCAARPAERTVAAASGSVPDRRHGSGGGERPRSHDRSCGEGCAAGAGEGGAARSRVLGRRDSHGEGRSGAVEAAGSGCTGPTNAPDDELSRRDVDDPGHRRRVHDVRTNRGSGSEWHRTREPNS